MYTIWQLIIKFFEEEHDINAAEKRRSKRLDAQYRADQITHIKGVFIQAWAYMTFPFRPATYRRYFWQRIHATPPNPKDLLELSLGIPGSGKLL